MGGVKLQTRYVGLTIQMNRKLNILKKIQKQGALNE